MFYIDASYKETIITKLLLQESQYANSTTIFFSFYLQKLKDKSEEIPKVKWRIRRKVFFSAKQNLKDVYYA